MLTETGYLKKTLVKSESVIKSEPEESTVMYSSDYYGRGYGNQTNFDRSMRRPYGRSRSGTRVRRNVENYRGNRRNNPIGPDGRISECVICGSRMHWARNCPHAYEKRDEKNYEDVQITLMSSHLPVVEDKLDVLLRETMGYALLDTGCSKTVCGKMWLDWFLDTLSDEERNKVSYYESFAVYKFGNGDKFKSLKCVRLSCEIVGIKVNIMADVIEAKIPLLLSKSSMKKAKMVIDLNCDEVSVFGKKS